MPGRSARPVVVLSGACRGRTPNEATPKGPRHVLAGLGQVGQRPARAATALRARQDGETWGHLPQGDFTGDCWWEGDISTGIHRVGSAVRAGECVYLRIYLGSLSPCQRWVSPVCSKCGDAGSAGLAVIGRRQITGLTPAARISASMSRDVADPRQPGRRLTARKAAKENQSTPMPRRQLQGPTLPAGSRHWTQRAGQAVSALRLPR